MKPLLTLAAMLALAVPVLAESRSVLVVVTITLNLGLYFDLSAPGTYTVTARHRFAYLPGEAVGRHPSATAPSPPSGHLTGAVAGTGSDTPSAL